MQTDDYLYGDEVTPPKVPTIIIQERVYLLNKHLKKLLDVPFYTRDGKRCNAIIKAIKFWEDMQ